MNQQLTPRALLDVLLRAGMVVALVIACYWVFKPFLHLMVWSVILAIMLYPLQVRLRRRMGPKEGRIATVIVVLSIAILLVPIYFMSMALADSAQQALQVARSGQLHIPPPPDSVAGWPIVGERLHALWSQAATDLSSLAQKFAPQIRSGARSALGALAGAGIGLLLFLAALIIAGIVMAFGETGTRAAERIAARLFGPGRGHHVAQLCTSTIRAVAQGVVGIAFIQMLLVGLGFVLMGVPGAALLALAVLVLGIMQVPATIVTVPVIAYVLATQGVSLWTIVFAVYVFVAGLVDNVLKPLLLGRGVEVPMPVVLIGALGGMVVGGIVGLFIGPVVLAVGYELFWQWVDQGDDPSLAPVPLAPPAPVSPPLDES
ncbi:AI-2E family transporter [Lysobacter helvus]|uniref:AI-2E family transporter n=2 Tax=Lysobacteraceae TaxID=32033 RepID=A0ABN6FU46_9GAMM|nr:MULTISPECIES: AI-2E family transporter [Lysobacter]BCT93222.1 AI-2E family transporter [Lysobacter caseinilyticus]BCT96374.1 AI-2E family transporter [Lysobacter helvus]